jgi:hypothetical protein
VASLSPQEVSDRWHRVLDHIEEARALANSLSGSLSDSLHGVKCEAEDLLARHLLQTERKARKDAGF